LGKSLLRHCWPLDQEVAPTIVNHKNRNVAMLGKIYSENSVAPVLGLLLID
jgi:hypothetical protein